MRIPWDDHLAGPQKVWFAIYDKTQERRLRSRVAMFRAKTEEYGYGWKYLDLTHAFAEWMGDHEYRDSYFEEPELFDSALDEFTDAVIERLRNVLDGDGVDNRTIVAITGIASLFGLTRVSRVVEGVADGIPGRLLVFFPGEREGNNYRLLEARDGWDYLSVPIEASSGANGA